MNRGSGTKRVAVVLALVVAGCAGLGPVNPAATSACSGSATKRECRLCCRSNTPRYGGTDWENSPITSSKVVCKCYDAPKEDE